MHIRYTLVPLALLALAGCTTESSIGTLSTSAASLNASPAGVAAMGFADIMTAIPGLLPGGAYASCVTAPTPTATATGTTQTISLAGCPSTSGGTMMGTLKVTTQTSAPGAYVVNFGTLTDTNTPAPVWTYAGNLNANVNVAKLTATVATQAGFQMTSTDPSKTNSTVTWTFICNLTATTDGAGNFNLTGSYSFSDTTDSVSVLITTPLTWVKGKSGPQTGVLAVTDTIAGVATPETVNVTFTNGTAAVSS